MEVNFTVKGKGQAIILIHGWAHSASIKSLEPLQAQLAENDFKVYNLELPGFGDSPTPPAHWGVEEYAQYVNQFIKEHVKEKNFILFGHSFGGSLTAYNAVKFNPKPSKIILCSSAGLRYKSLKAKLLFPISKVLKILLKALPERFAKSIKKTIYYHIIRERDYIDSEGKQEQFRRVINHDIEEVFSNIKIPTLIIWGEDDKVTPLKMGKQLHTLIQNSKLEVIQGRHGIPFTNTTKITELIKNFK